MSSARVIIDVVAGVIPGTPEPELSKRWVLSSAEWDVLTLAPDPSAMGASAALAELAGRANAYAALLMIQPDRVNWVRTEWVWL